MAGSHPIVEGVAFFVAALVATWVWQSGFFFSPDNAIWLTPLTWLFVATLATWPSHGARDLLSADHWIGEWWTTIRQLVVVTITILPLFAVVYLVYSSWQGSSVSPAWPVQWQTIVLYQLIYVGLPEEFFFRGYLQQRFDDALGRPYRLIGASWGGGLLMANLLFAVAHVALSSDVSRLIVFFPGLLFGWLQARTNALIAPVLVHGFSNILLITLQAWVTS